MARQFTLSDGRKLDYRVAGKPDATPLLWFHGTPGASLPPPGIEAACEKYGLSIISFSRPGYGSSTRQKGRLVADTVVDAAELMKHLGHTRFYTGGWSGGGPYALTTAIKLPGCLAALVIAGVAPYDGEGLDYLAGQGQDNIDETNAALTGEEALQAFTKPRRVEMLQASVEELVEGLSSVLPEVDQRALLDGGDLGSYTVATFAEALTGSSDGWVDDDLAFTLPWGVNVKDIRVPVFLHHGSLDAAVPFAHGEWIAAHIPKEYLTKHFEQGEGHVSIYVGRVDGMISELVASTS
ncbi:hypothetical protein AMS68_004511 [Peltaster fructicola]|uniref:AB hydrolase-1 domain-containing protein n=1 Tax=Peltaster fructicola TaxID=286661 RepID=A0A6H0XW94_9PEZI|nr:hypothetical protein AMS68_004511 [Peltaster fructicola]